MADFNLADAEFDRQTIILEALLRTVDICARTKSPAVLDGEELPPIPAGGQNTMAAAAVVLLAAHFEEYIRQQVEEYARAVVGEYSHLDFDLRERLIDTYWRAGSGRLNRIRPRINPVWISDAGSLLRSLIKYPVEDDTREFLAELMSEHENNMRWETIAELTARVRIRRLSDHMFKSTPLRRNVGTVRKDDFAVAIRRKLNEFYDLRNGIVHSIAQISGIGATIFNEWASFFRLFTTAFAKALEENFDRFSAVVEAKKGS